MRRISVAAVLLACACGAAAEPPIDPLQELSIESRGARLGATLYLPSSPGKHPAVVLVHGSGRTTAMEMGRNFAPRLNAMGFAVLAYDKRGVGRSTGEYTGIGPGNSVAMFDLLAGDALAAVESLRTRRDIDPDRVGLLGVSQGGWIAPLAASRSGSVAFAILISGPAVTVGEEIAYSRLAGADPGSRQGLSDDEIAREFAAFEGPHGYDPAAAIRAMRAPSLWIIGGHDRSIPVKETLANLERIRNESGAPLTVHVIAGADHGLRHAVTGEPQDFWSTIGAWLGARGIMR
jgi:alpha-beta hydrolase superfamily lysophospholipase